MGQCLTILKKQQFVPDIYVCLLLKPLKPCFYILCHYVLQQSNHQITEENYIKLKKIVFSSYIKNQDRLDDINILTECLFINHKVVTDKILHKVFYKNLQSLPNQLKGKKYRNNLTDKRKLYYQLKYFLIECEIYD